MVVSRAVPVDRSIECNHDAAGRHWNGHLQASSVAQGHDLFPILQAPQEFRSDLGLKMGVRKVHNVPTPREKGLSLGLCVSMLAF